MLKTNCNLKWEVISLSVCVNHYFFRRNKKLLPVMFQISITSLQACPHDSHMTITWCIMWPRSSLFSVNIPVCYIIQKFRCNWYRFQEHLTWRPLYGHGPLQCIMGPFAMHHGMLFFPQSHHVQKMKHSLDTNNVHFSYDLITEHIRNTKMDFAANMLLCVSL